MKLIRWSYSRRNMVRAYFDTHPNSVFYFRRMKRCFLLYSLDWREEDPFVDAASREEMQLLLNEAMGRKTAYQNRKHHTG